MCSACAKIAADPVSANTVDNGTSVRLAAGRRYVCMTDGALAASRVMEEVYVSTTVCERGVNCATERLFASISDSALTVSNAAVSQFVSITGGETLANHAEVRAFVHMIAGGRLAIYVSPQIGWCIERRFA